MPRNRLRPLAIAGAWAALVLNLNSALAQEKPASPVGSRVLLIPKRPGPSAGSASGSGGWWLGTAGIAGALAVFGGASLASKKFLPTRETGPIRVVGRASLSTKHAVHLLRVGDRVLIVGTGPQGAPSTLGEVTDPAELARLVPRRASRAAEAVPPSTTFDPRIGGDE